LLCQESNKTNKKIKKLFEDYICADIPSAFSNRKQHMVELPYDKKFNERNISTKAYLIQMNKELLEFCKMKIQSLLDKKFILGLLNTLGVVWPSMSTIKLKGNEVFQD